MSKQPKTVRAVVADDYQDVATSMASLLPLMYPGRLDVSLAFDGEEAVRLTKSLKPSVAFLDVGMPGTDGIQAAFAIRKALGGDAPVLVAVSGDADRVTRRMEQPVRPYLVQAAGCRAACRRVQVHCAAPGRQ